ncbi:MAG: hypothetical protein AAF664_09485 [Planctomycetota bacterium]
MSLALKVGVPGLVAILVLGRGQALVRFQELKTFVVGDSAARSALEVFDENAFVVVTAGPDGKPGRADVDDGANGKVDELIELGATGSDDEIVVFGGNAEEAMKALTVPHRVLSRGAYVPLEDTFVPANAKSRRWLAAKFNDETKVSLLSNVE